MDNVIPFGNARAHRIETAMRCWNTLPTSTQELVLNLVDGHEHLDSLGAATAAELVEHGLLERDGSGLGWTPLGWDMRSFLGDKGGPDAS